MKRKFFLLAVLSVGLCSILGAQQQPVVSQYMLNNYFLNPAYRGGSQLSLTALHRAQWAGYDDYTGERASQKLDFFNASFSPDSTGHNVGLQFLHDQLGSIATTSVLVSYAYRIAMTRRAGLSLGFRGGVSTKAIDFGERRILHPDDPYVPEGRQSDTKPDVTLGLWLDHERYYIGISAKGFVTSSDFEAVGVRNEQLLTATAGYHARLSADWIFTPSVQVMSNTDRTVVDASLLFQKQQTVWAGLSYRHEEAAVALLGIGLFDSKVRVSYAYDYVTTNRSIKTGSSHEIMVRYGIGSWHPRKRVVRAQE